MRLFVAAELPDNLLDALSETSALLRGTVHGRYVPPSNFHVTLAFLGEVSGSRIPALTDALEGACAEHGPFDVALGALGSFGKARHATLWQSLDGGEELTALAHTVRSGLSDAGFPFDEKGFLAHVTLMRGADLSHGELPMPVCAEGIVDTVTLFSSEQSGQRRVYTPLERFALERA